MEEFICKSGEGMWTGDEECERQGTGKRGQIEKWARVDRVNKHSREVLSPRTGRGLVCVCVYVCVYQTQLAPICPGMSLHLSEAQACPALKASVWCVCMYVSVCVHNNSFIRALHGTGEHIKHPDIHLLYAYYMCILLYVHFKHTHRHTHTHTHTQTAIPAHT